MSAFGGKAGSRGALGRAPDSAGEVRKSERNVLTHRSFPACFADHTSSPPPYHLATPQCVWPYRMPTYEGFNLGFSALRARNVHCDHSHQGESVIGWFQEPRISTERNLTSKTLSLRALGRCHDRAARRAVCHFPRGSGQRSQSYP